MSKKEVATLLFRRGSTSEWASRNPVLLAGEPGFDYLLRILKVGDGTTHWLDLPGHSVDGDAENDVPAGLNVIGDGQFVILEANADASAVPDGTFIARLPDGFPL
jgi:hypothetical protein